MSSSCFDPWATPPMATVPVKRPSPASARSNWLCPLPTTPAMPTISPAVAVRMTLEKPSPEHARRRQHRDAVHAGGRCLGGNVESSCRPDDECEQLLVGDRRRPRERSAQLAVAQHGDPVGELPDLGEPVGDVDDGAAARPRPPGRGRKSSSTLSWPSGAVGSSRMSRRGREDQRLGDLEQVLLRDAQVLDPVGEVGRRADAGEHRPHRGALASAGPENARAGPRPGCSPRPSCRAGRPGAGARWRCRGSVAAAGSSAAIDSPCERDGPGVGLGGPGRDAHQSRLARAVLAEQGVDLARRIPRARRPSARRRRRSDLLIPLMTRVGC